MEVQKTKTMCVLLNTLGINPIETDESLVLNVSLDVLAYKLCSMEDDIQGVFGETQELKELFHLINIKYGKF